MATRPSLAPSITCQNVDKTYEYFTHTLGFAGTGKWAGPDGRTMYATAVLPTKYGEACIMFGSLRDATSGQFGDMGQFGENLKSSPNTLGNGVVLWFSVPDVDKYFAFIRGRGAIIDEPPTDQFWGDRTISVLTPDGFYLTFSTPLKGFQAPEGMGDADGTGAVQATAPGTKAIRIPGLKATKAAAKKTGPGKAAKKATSTKSKKKR